MSIRHTPSGRSRSVAVKYFPCLPTREWFEHAGEWWGAAAEDDVARNAQPVGVSSGGTLYVLCSNVPWSTNLRLLAPRIVGLLNARRPPGVPPASAIAVLEPPPLPDELVEQWADLAGADLADQIRPHSLTDWGQELITEAESAQARDLLAHRAPAVLARLRAVLPETSIVRLGQSRLRAVWVLVASAPGFSDQQALENALMEVWHDVTQAFGPEHELRFVHAGETAADQMVEAWGTAVADADPTRPPRIDAFVSRAAVAADDVEGARRRNEGLEGEQSWELLAAGATLRQRGHGL